MKMKPPWLLLTAAVLTATPAHAQITPQPAGTPAPRVPRPMAVPADFNDHEGYTSLFDGTTLTGWAGDAKVWSVADGAIVGQYSSPAGTRNPQTFLILQGQQPADFELKLEIKLEGVDADSGIQYRSFPAAPVPRPGIPASALGDPRYSIGGYQFDFNFIGTYPGQLAEGFGRGIIAARGQVVHAETGKPLRVIGSLGSKEALGGYWKQNDWNEVHLIARGNTLTQILNGHVMAILIDDDTTKSKAKGLIGLQTAGPGTVKISFRNLWLRNE